MIFYPSYILVSNCLNLADQTINFLARIATKKCDFLHQRFQYVVDHLKPKKQPKYLSVYIFFCHENVLKKCDCENYILAGIVNKLIRLHLSKYYS